jgi:hypothetical protein
LWTDRAAEEDALLGTLPLVLRCHDRRRQLATAGGWGLQLRVQPSPFRRVTPGAGTCRVVASVLFGTRASFLGDNKHPNRFQTYFKPNIERWTFQKTSGEGIRARKEWSGRGRARRGGVEEEKDVEHGAERRGLEHLRVVVMHLR